LLASFRRARLPDLQPGRGSTALGSASPPAVQAYIARRTKASSDQRALRHRLSFGLGTIIGPAIAPLFIFQPLGLSGPLIVFAAIGAIVLAALVFRLPDDTAQASSTRPGRRIPLDGRFGWRRRARSRQRPDIGRAALDRRTNPALEHHRSGGGHGYAALLGVIGFLVIDRLNLPAEQAQQPIAIVLMFGAVATLLGQWWLIPQLHLSPRALVIWGSALAAAGSVLVGLAGGIYGLTLSFALASLGFGPLPPGFTSGASLAVGPGAQNAVRGWSPR
jgi:MFS family permease